MAQQVFEQLPLSIQLRDDATFENYFSADNSQVVEQLKRSSSGDGEQCIYISGQLEAGCSHLLQAACHMAEKAGLNSVYLPMEELVEYSPAVFDSLESLPLVSLDNIQVLAGKPEWEEALFHLFNRTRDAGSRLLIAGNGSPDDIGLKLPDLVSRLNWGLVYSLQPMDEGQRIGALQHRAHNRGMEMSEDVARYLFNHGPEKLADMFDVLDKLDSASLSAQRRLTRPFVKEVMNW